jgi:transposase
MATGFVNIDRDTPLLLPPDLRDWVPASHLAHFIIDAVEALDLRQVNVNTRGTGDAQYPPTMLLGLLVYSYATGTFGSRRIEQSTYDNIAVRLLTADTHPDHDTICTFRRENKALLSESFVKVLQLAQELKLAQFGQITVSIDGTKIAANASKHSAVSYQRAGQLIEQLEGEVQQLLAKAEQADATPLQDGLTIPEEQHNFTDSESRIMKTGGGFEQCYNAQAAVDVDSRLIVGERVSQAPNDKQELVSAARCRQGIDRMDPGMPGLQLPPPAHARSHDESGRRRVKIACRGQAGAKSIRKVGFRRALRAALAARRG